MSDATSQQNPNIQIEKANDPLQDVSLETGPEAKEVEVRKSTRVSDSRILLQSEGEQFEARMQNQASSQQLITLPDETNDQDYLKTSPQAEVEQAVNCKEEPDSTEKIKKQAQGAKIRIDLTGTKYKVIKDVCTQMGWKAVYAKKSAQPLLEKPAEHESRRVKQEWQAQQETLKREETTRHAGVDIIWHDVMIMPEKLAQLKSHQKVNHFPSMSGVTKKNQLATSLKKMKTLFPVDYGFFPKTWTIPNQLKKLRKDIADERAAKGGPHPVLIVKPSESCQGKGIFLIDDLEKLKDHLNFGDKTKMMTGQGHVVQKYITNPYLLDGLKFDLRLYVVVTSCSPLTIFWHKEGLARFATLPYTAPVNIGKDLPQNVHLTNYAVNKDSEHFKISEQDIKAGTSSKRRLETVYARLEKDGVDIPLLRLKIADLIIKTLISIQPELMHSYRMCQPNDRTYNMCFEILGFDVLIDSNTKPWLLEVNQAPSFQTDSDLDLEIKQSVLHDTFQLLGMTEQNRQKNINRMLRDRELKKMHKQSTLFWNQMRSEEFAKELEERRRYQINNMGGFYKVFPIEDSGESLSGGLFKNSISKKAKNYYSKFERDGGQSKEVDLNTTQASQEVVRPQLEQVSPAPMLVQKLQTNSSQIVANRTLKHDSSSFEYAKQSAIVHRSGQNESFFASTNPGFNITKLGNSGQNTKTLFYRGIPFVVNPTGKVTLMPQAKPADQKQDLPSTKFKTQQQTLTTTQLTNIMFNIGSLNPAMAESKFKQGMVSEDQPKLKKKEYTSIEMPILAHLQNTTNKGKEKNVLTGAGKMKGAKPGSGYRQTENRDQQQEDVHLANQKRAENFKGYLGQTHLQQILIEQGISVKGDGLSMTKSGVDLREERQKESRERQRYHSSVQSPTDGRSITGPFQLAGQMAFSGQNSFEAERHAIAKQPKTELTDGNFVRQESSPVKRNFGLNTSQFYVQKGNQILCNQNLDATGESKFSDKQMPIPPLVGSQGNAKRNSFQPALEEYTALATGRFANTMVIQQNQRMKIITDSNESSPRVVQEHSPSVQLRFQRKQIAGVPRPRNTSSLQAPQWTERYSSQNMQSVSRDNNFQSADSKLQQLKNFGFQQTSSQIFKNRSGSVQQNYMISSEKPVQYVNQNQQPVIFQQNHYHFNSGTGQPLIVVVGSPNNLEQLQENGQLKGIALSQTNKSGFGQQSNSRINNIRIITEENPASRGGHTKSKELGMRNQKRGNEKIKQQQKHKVSYPSNLN